MELRDILERLRPPPSKPTRGTIFCVYGFAEALFSERELFHSIFILLRWDFMWRRAPSIEIQKFAWQKRKIEHLVDLQRFHSVPHNWAKPFASVKVVSEKSFVIFQTSYWILSGSATKVSDRPPRITHKIPAIKLFASYYTFPLQSTCYLSGSGSN